MSDSSTLRANLFLIRFDSPVGKCALAFFFSMLSLSTTPCEHTAWGQQATSSTKDSLPDDQSADSNTSLDTSDEDLQAPADVEIDPQAEDSQIEQRLRDILQATTWFTAPKVRVDQGVVFLTGVTKSTDHKTWAGDLARNTQDVVAVVNRIQVEQRSIWDLSPAMQEIRRLGSEAIQLLPLLGLAALVLIFTWFATGWAVRLSRHIFSRRVHNRLLVSVLSRGVAIPVSLVGLYIALRISGLTQIAATVLGGTGVAGLIIGIAFRDIAENFLASVLISVQRPFALGDQIEIEGYKGIVQSVTARGTLLMTLDGNHVQIPNAAVYKSIIRNVTANPNIRNEFMVGIDYGDSIPEAQQVVLEVLNAHPAVLKKPDPMVLVDELGAATVNLKIYFWVDGHQHSVIKVRSALIRLTKLAIEEAGLTMPDESREVIFPRGVPVTLRRESGESTKTGSSGQDKSRDPSLTFSPNASVREATPQKIPVERRQSSNAAEDDLSSEHDEIQEQARNSRQPEQGENLLE